MCKFFKQINKKNIAVESIGERKRLNAKIIWLSSEQGGRKYLPKGDKYVPLITIDDLPLDPNKECWGLFVSNIEIISELETIAEVWYLSDKAPNNLFKNVEFNLYEGANKVASGIIL
jgi:hypothetical protein